jgi:hypothetical protein
MFYFRATKSFHDNSRQGPDNRAGTSRTAPGSTTLSPAFTARADSRANSPAPSRGCVAAPR